MQIRAGRRRRGGVGHARARGGYDLSPTFPKIFRMTCTEQIRRNFLTTRYGISTLLLMGKVYFTEQQAIGLLEDARGGKSQAQFASELKIKQQALNDALHGKRRIPKEALAHIGLKDSGFMYEAVERKVVKRGK
jgi:hypothetical protein